MILIGEPISIIESFEGVWKDVSVESTCKTDIVIEKDRYGKPILIPNPPIPRPGRRIKPREKYKLHRIHKYSESEDDVYRHWKNQNQSLIQDLCISRNRKIPSITTLINYKQNWIRKCSQLSQFACELCIVKFGYLHKTLHGILAKQHRCKTSLCPNFALPMGVNGCTCDHCNNCLIHKLQALSPYDLLQELCCSSRNVVPKLKCASGQCQSGNCHIHQYESLLNHGNGCHTFTSPNSQTKIRYPVCTESSDSDMDKDRDIIVYDESPWSEFKDIYIEKQREFLQHRYDRDWQNHCRDRIATPDVNGNIHLKPHTLFSSMDFIHSVRLKPKILTSATQTRLAIT